ncbi:MAG: alpha/beta fold hydrolase [Myxococcota bacterium]
MTSALPPSLAVHRVHAALAGPPSAPALLFGHSLLLDGRMWEAQVAALAADHFCINVDFQGHGRARRPAAGFSMRDQAEDYRRVLDALGVRQAIVVGLSMGGMAGMHLALEHPERVRGLALFNTNADAQPLPSRARITLLAAAARALGLVPFLRRQALAELFSPAFRAAHPEVVRAWDERVAALDRTSALRAIDMVIKRPSIVHRLSAIRVPTMVVGGRDDGATPPGYGRRIAQRIAGAEWHLLPCGHVSAVEEPERVTALIRAFAARVAGVTPAAGAR